MRAETKLVIVARGRIADKNFIVCDLLREVGTELFEVANIKLGYSPSKVEVDTKSRLESPCEHLVARDTKAELYRNRTRYTTRS